MSHTEYFVDLSGMIMTSRFFYAFSLLLSASVSAQDWYPIQATGAPDTPEYGDHVTAWASATPDDSPEWLLLSYSQAVKPARLRVWQSYNPGAIVKISGFSADNVEIVLWQGKDPLAGTATVGVAEFALQADVPVNRVKLYLASDQVAGWNEIDAVQLEDHAGNQQWASGAKASSTYGAESSAADGSAGEPVPVVWQAAQLQDEFLPFLNQPLQIQLVNNQTMQATLLRSGPDFLLLQAGERQLLLNKSQILQVSLGPGAVPVPAK